MAYVTCRLGNDGGMQDSSHSFLEHLNQTKHSELGCTVAQGRLCLSSCVSHPFPSPFLYGFSLTFLLHLSPPPITSSPPLLLPLPLF